MKMDCEIIQDLLPLYAEEIASEKSRLLVEEHLSDCGECQRRLRQMKEPEPQIAHSAEPMKRFRREMKKHTAVAAALAAFLTMALIVVLWGLFFLDGSDAMGYGLICFYWLMPVCAFVCTLFASIRKSGFNYVLPLWFGLIGLLVPYLVSRSTDWLFFWMDLIPALLGLAIGTAVYVRKKKKESMRL